MTRKRAAVPLDTLTMATPSATTTWELDWDANPTSQLTAWTDGTTATRFTDGPRSRLWATTGTTSAPFHYRPDQTPTPTTATAGLLAATTYDPYGHPGTELAAPAIGYRGELATHAQLHLRNRDHHPNLRRFATHDPLDGIGGTTTETNPYHYTNNNPTNLTDPNGTSPIDPEFVLSMALRSALGDVSQTLASLLYISTLEGNQDWQRWIDPVGAYIAEAECALTGLTCDQLEELDALTAVLGVIYDGLDQAVPYAALVAGFLPGLGELTDAGYCGSGLSNDPDSAATVIDCAALLIPLVPSATDDVLGAIRSSGRHAPSATPGRIPWNSYADYPKVTIGGREYANVGGRPYTQHAVDRMQPSGLGAPAGASGPGRSIAPQYVDDVLTSPQTVRKPVTGPNGEARVSHVSGTVEVITEGDIVITVITR